MHSLTRFQVAFSEFESQMFFLFIHLWRQCIEPLHWTITLLFRTAPGAHPRSIIVEVRDLTSLFLFRIILIVSGDKG
jgi:hypothetical protein